MGKIVGSVRLVLALLLVFIAMVAVLVTSFIPGEIRGIRLAPWSVNIVVRMICFVFRIHVSSPDMAAIQRHSGLIFPNHLSALDAVILYSSTPCRFLAADDVEHRFLIGRIARGIGTIFVKRDSPRSRVEARQQAARALKHNPLPPIVLFPEGRLGPGDTLFPFRHGAFGIAVEGEIPFLPCAIRYEPQEVVLWRAAAEGEGMWQSIWRMVQYTGKVQAVITPLDVVYPKTGDDPRQMARETRQNIARTLGMTLDDSA